MEQEFEEKDVMEQEGDEGVDQDGHERPAATGQPAAKKRRLVKYHRVHAHRNPLSDGLYE